MTTGKHTPDDSCGWRRIAMLAVLAMLTVTAQGQHTNGPISGSGEGITNANWRYRIPATEITNAVRDLAASGDICKVFGHSWPTVSMQMLYVINNCADTWTRTCRLCGKPESKTEGD